MSKDLNITFVDKNGNPLWVTFTFSETGQKITYTDIYLKNNSHVRLVKSKYEDGSVVLSRDYANDVLFDNEKDMNEYIKEQFPFTPYSIDMENGIISVYEEPEREISGAHPSDSLDNVVKNYESFDEEDFVVRDKETGNYIWFLRETGGGIEVCYFDKDYNKIEPFIKESGSVFSSMKSFVTASLSDKDLSQMEVVETLMFKPFAEQEWFTTESKNLYLKYKTDFDAALKDVKDINAPLRVCDVICDFNKNTSEESLRPLCVFFSLKSNYILPFFRLKIMIDRRNDICLFHTFQKIALGFQAHHFHHGFLVCFSGEKYDRDLRRIGLTPQHLEHFCAVRDRHIIVHQDQVRTVSRDVFDRLHT